jgi:hypothetical protein
VVIVKLLAVVLVAVVYVCTFTRLTVGQVYPYISAESYSKSLPTLGQGVVVVF